MTDWAPFAYPRRSTPSAQPRSAWSSTCESAACVIAAMISRSLTLATRSSVLQTFCGADKGQSKICWRYRMHLFRLDASIRTTGSVSRALADTAEQAWLAEHPGATVTRRDVGREPLPSELWAKAALAKVDPSAVAPPEAAALTERLSAELLDADAYVFAVPLYNY